MVWLGGLPTLQLKSPRQKNGILGYSDPAAAKHVRVRSTIVEVPHAPCLLAAHTTLQYPWQYFQNCNVLLVSAFYCSDAKHMHPLCHWSQCGRACLTPRSIILHLSDPVFQLQWNVWKGQFPRIEFLPLGPLECLWSECLSLQTAWEPPPLCSLPRLLCCCHNARFQHWPLPTTTYHRCPLLLSGRAKESKWHQCSQVRQFWCRPRFKPSPFRPGVIQEMSRPEVKRWAWLPASRCRWLAPIAAKPTAIASKWQKRCTSGMSHKVRAYSIIAIKAVDSASKDGWSQGPISSLTSPAAKPTLQKVTWPSFCVSRMAMKAQVARPSLQEPSVKRW